MIRMRRGPYRYTVAVLHDGGRVFIRPVCPEDRNSLDSYFRGLSPSTAYRRFHGFRQQLSGAELRRLSDSKFPAHVGLVATPCGSEQHECQILAEALYVADCGSRIAEMAISVADKHQRRGIGSLMLEGLVRWADYAGLVRIDAEVLASNEEALRFLARHGFHYDSRPVSSVCRVFLAIHPRYDSVSRVGDRVIEGSDDLRSARDARR